MFSPMVSYLNIKIAQQFHLNLIARMCRLSKIQFMSSYHQTTTDLTSYSLSTKGHFQLVEKGKYCFIPQPFDGTILSLW